ncbi:MAG: molybdopterin-dependent oxidoreductase, partial [Clostridia bacterium]|nr:molybdopterin-dependent oxidoreductase [Clostridia bacterium]
MTSLARDPVVLLVTGRDRAAAAAALDLAAALRERDREAGVLVLNAQANARGAEAMGLLPWLLPGYRPVADATARAELEAAWRRPLPATPGRNAAAALAAAAAGEVAALYVVAANPAVTFPDAALWQAAVRSGAFLVVQELFLTETARAADLVLPAASPFEKAGHYTSLDGLAQESRAPLPPVEGALPDGVILEGLARGLGYRRLRPSDQELAWAVQAVPLEPEAPAWDPTGDAPRPTGMLDVGGRRLAVVGVPRLYAGEGTAAADPGLAGVRPAPFLLLHPEDAAAAGLADGDEVEVETDLGNAALRVQVSDALVPGAAGVGERLGRLPHPWVAAGGAVRVRAEAGAGR